jgi:hypothetical protein
VSARSGGERTRQLSSPERGGPPIRPVRAGVADCPRTAQPAVCSGPIPAGWLRPSPTRLPRRNVTGKQCQSPASPRRSSRGGRRRSCRLLPTSDHGSGHSWWRPEHQSCRTIRPPKWSLRLRLRAARPRTPATDRPVAWRPDPSSSAEAQTSGSSRPRTTAFGTPSSSAGRRPNHHTAYAHALRQSFEGVRMVIG